MDEAAPRGRRRAAVRPAIREVSDSEDELQVKPKRPRRYSSDDDYHDRDVDEDAKPSRRPAALLTSKPAASTASRRTRAAQDKSRRHVSSTKSSAPSPEQDDNWTARQRDGSEDFDYYEGEGRKTVKEKFEYSESYGNKHEASSSSTYTRDETDHHEMHVLSSKVEMEWTESDFLAEHENLDQRIARNLVKLFEEDNTIPFIARYRKELTGNMEPEKLRCVKETFEEIKHIKHKAASMLKNIEKAGKLTSFVRRSILCAKSINELDVINTPFKTGSKRTLAERARQLGLEGAAQAVLDGSECISLSAFIDREKEGLCSEQEVQLGIQHIIADIISKDRSVLDFIRELKKTTNIRLESSRAKGTVAKEISKGSSKDKSNMKIKSLSAAEKQKLQSKIDEESKFRNYFEFGMNIKYIKPHQVLAINRGENQKELTVRIVVPDFVLDKLISFCHQHWLSRGIQYQLRSKLFEDSIRDSYNRLILPLVVRQVRSELNQSAERASIEVFAQNLTKLLLMPPYRGHVVLGIDPGFRNGCKVALVGQNGNVLETGLINLNYGVRTWSVREDGDAQWIRQIMVKHRCEVIALGNGTACRETEEFLSEMIQTGFFKPHLHDVSYAIVNEQGASIYSCSKEARIEFPNTDPNLISAVSIARRLQDPLAELVKVEPKHLGVGMYQHDVPEKKLSSTLDEIVVECVSFVGVDLNSAPHCLLRRVAGLNASRAEKILEYRKKNGPFITREDIKKVKGIGEKSFEQCAGFIRILPETIRHETGTKKCNPLDRTWIHPESYKFANRFLDFCHVNPETIGSNDAIKTISKAIENAGGLRSLGAKLDMNEALVKLITEGLQMPANHDLRSEFEKPLFRKGLTSIKELHSGDILTGRVTNITHFGAFVDIGVGQNGLVHNSGMGGKKPQFGDKVQVKVLNIELSRQRIGLQLLAVL